MTVTTENLTDEQRTEVRRTLLQSIAEIGRGLDLAKRQLKKGMFAGAKDTISGTEAMLVLHEGMANLLLKENQLLRAKLEGVEELIVGRAAAFNQTADRMTQEGLKPKSERSPDHDYDDTLRYQMYAAESRTAAHIVTRFLKGE